MTTPPSRFAPGQRVWLRARPEVSAVVMETLAGGVRVMLADGSGERTFGAADLIVEAPPGRPRFTGREQFLSRLARIKLTGRLADTFYAMGSARTSFEAYQFKPAFKFLDGGCRAILIADEVGLGKTIEAGYIYLEMKARFEMRRTLVVCPSGLRFKWQDELRHRFDEEFEILDAARLRDFLLRYREYDTFTPLRGIGSLELLRREEFQTAFAELAVRFDLVIVDEAHHLRNPETASHEVIEAIRAHADALVFLTATPLQLQERDLFTLLHLLDPGAFVTAIDFADTIAPNARINAVLSALGPPADLPLVHEHFALLNAPELLGRFSRDPYFLRAGETLDQLARRTPAIAAGPGATADGDRAAALVSVQQDVQRLNPLAHVLTRTRKREVQSAAVRSPQTQRVALSAAEAEFYQSVIAWVREEATQSGRDVSGFVQVARERQVASSMLAALEYFRDLAGAGRTDLGMQGLDLSDEELDEETDPPSLRAGSLDAVLRAGNRLGRSDSKYDSFSAALAHALPESRGRKAIVFAFFRRTLAYLRRRLREEGYAVYLIDGGVPSVERAEVVRAFRESTAEAGTVLLSSEVGAEGLDFQFCDTLFNYDLPWNPMRVEQRIGRLDRYGQQSERIRIVHFILENTIEERVLERLYDRIGVFRDAIGELEPILGETVSGLIHDLFRRDLTPAEERHAAAQMEQQIENRRHELAVFEARQAELLGQDDAIMVELSEARESGRTLAADELRCLLAEALAADERLARTRLERLPRMPEGVWQLTGGAALAAAAAAHQAALGRDRATGEGVLPLLKRLHAGETVWLTFDGAVAQRHPGLPYLHPRHPFVRFAAAQGRQPGRAEALASPGNFALYGRDLPPGACLLFIYLLDEHSANARQTLWPVAVCDGHADAELGRRLFGRVAEAAQADAPPPGAAPPPETLPAALDLADLAAEAQRGAAQEEAQHRNAAFLNARLQALERTARAQIAQASQRLAASTDERILRMYRGRIQNLEERLRQQTAELDARRHVSVSSELVAVAALQIVAAEPPPRAAPAPERRPAPPPPPQRRGAIPIELEPLP